MNSDPELSSEVVGFLGRELKTARNRVKELESHLEDLNQVRYLANTHLIFLVGLDFCLRNANPLKMLQKKPGRCRTRKQEVARDG